MGSQKKEKNPREERLRNNSDSSWYQKRGKEREILRKENSKDQDHWTFQRAKHRKDVRYEETRGDWYFQRKQGLKHEESQYPSHFQGEKEKGENKRNFVRSKGETERESKRRKRPV